MESFEIIVYKWQTGCYDLKDLIFLVQNKTISKKDFFDITRFYFDIVQKKCLKENKGDNNEQYTTIDT